MTFTTMDGNSAAGALMALTQGVASWYAVVPDLRQVQNKTPDDETFMADFRRTEITAATLTVGIGAIGSVLLKSLYPLLASVLIVVVLVLVYEWSYRADPPVETTEGKM